MTRHLFFIAALLFVLVPTSNAQLPRKLNDSLNSFLQSEIKRLKIPGLAVAVVQEGRVLFQTTMGVAVKEWNNPVTPHTNFQIASATKLLTSSLVMKALYQKRIRLNDAVGQYVDGIPAAWNNMQLRHLLNHSSGIPAFTGDASASTSEVVAALKDSALLYPVGTRQQYGNYDYALLGFILEKVYRKPFAEILKEELAVPAGMKDGGFDYEEKRGGFVRTAVLTQKATTYYGSAQAYAYKFFYPQSTYPAGGYYASLHDMINWAVALDKEMLFPKSFLQQYAFSKDSIGNGVSAYTRTGWITEKEGNILYAGHSGGPGLADVIRFPASGITVIALCNDGELLPGLARAAAAFFVPALRRVMQLKKFKR